MSRELHPEARWNDPMDGCKTILGWIFGITMTMMEKLDGAGGGLG
jgi:hypothetical protein